ncbi:MAG: SulP family inorganic anion transporter, partial [Chlamydiae bacterium]|nr:SulP family inorganic anion transporter [Chlamydiota bacterium]
DIDPIGSRFGAISNQLSLPPVPAFSWAKTELVFHDAVMIALLIAIESIVSTSVADGMIRGKTRYDCELVSQGVANITSVMFGGIPASGSLSRWMACVKMGAKTPIAGMIHAIVIGVITFFFAPLLTFIPIATIAAVLVMLAWNMFEFKHFINFFKAPRADLLVLLVTFGLILFADLMVGVEIGIVLSTSLFIKRMSENENAIKLSQIFSPKARKLTDPEAIEKKTVPEQVEVYEINGPFFFGIVERFKDIMNREGPSPKVFILRMRKVPFVDATAMRAINELHDKCLKQKTTLILSGVFGQAEKDIRRIGMEKKIGKQNIFRDIDSALLRTQQILQDSGPSPDPQKEPSPTVVLETTG